MKKIKKISLHNLSQAELISCLFCLAIPIFLVCCLSKHSQDKKQSEIIRDSLFAPLNQKSAGGKLPCVNIRKKFPAKSFTLQECTEVEYIPLETRSDVLLDGAISRYCYMSDSLIVTRTYEGTVVVFDRSGKILNCFNHKGRGPEEYWELRAMTVDFEREEVYIYDYPAYYRIRVYGLDGKYKRTLGTPRGMISGFYLYSHGDYLLCYDRTKSWDYPAENIVASFNPQPYFLLNKKDGSVTPLNIHLEKFVSDRALTPAMGGKKIRHTTISFVPVRKNGTQVYISDAGLDTIYQLAGTKAVPFLVKEPSVVNREIPLLAWITVKTNRYTYLISIEKRPSTSEEIFTSPMFTLYDHYTGECYFSGSNLTNSDYLSEESVHLDPRFDELPENCVKALLSPVSLLEDYRAGNLKGKLKEVASRLKEDDNPVLMLVKFKD